MKKNYAVGVNTIYELEDEYLKSRKHVTPGNDNQLSNSKLNQGDQQEDDLDVRLDFKAIEEDDEESQAGLVDSFIQ